MSRILFSAVLSFLPVQIKATTELSPFASKRLVLSAPAGSQFPNITAASDGTLHLTYYGPASPAGPSNARTLWHSIADPGSNSFSPARPIVTSEKLYENWADFASLVVGTDGALTAQWYEHPSSETTEYEGWFSRSANGGKTWSRARRLGHEFVNLHSLSEGRTLAVWLNATGANSHHGHGAEGVSGPLMKVMSRVISADGQTLSEATVDPDVCTCCHITVSSAGQSGVFASYRGHTSAEIRDNRYVRFDIASFAWSAPATLHNDGWRIAGCPVNGPAAAGYEEGLCVVWFTGANDLSQVKARYSEDGGITFGSPVRVDLGRPLGRLETVMLKDKTAVVLWMEAAQGTSTAHYYARRLWPDGRLTTPKLIFTTTQGRVSSFPRGVLRETGNIAIALTRPGEVPQVEVLEIVPETLTEY